MSASPSSSAFPAILWFRNDLRLEDNAALHAASEGKILPVYVLDDEAAGRWTVGAAGRWWLHHSLKALAGALREFGSSLLLLRGRAENLIPQLAREIGAATVHAAALAAPWARRRDAAIAKALQADGRRLELHDSSLVRPDSIRTGQGKPYAVYTPFARAAMKLGDPPPPIPPPGRLDGATAPTGGVSLEALATMKARAG